MKGILHSKPALCKSIDPHVPDDTQEFTWHTCAVRPFGSKVQRNNPNRKLFKVSFKCSVLDVQRNPEQLSKAWTISLTPAAATESFLCSD